MSRRPLPPAAKAACQQLHSHKERKPNILDESTETVWERRELFEVREVEQEHKSTLFVRELIEKNSKERSNQRLK